MQQKKLKEEKDNATLSTLISDGPIRMITQGQELTPELDEKTLQEMMFKDSQVCRRIFVLLFEIFHQILFLNFVFLVCLCLGGCFETSEDERCF